jgi:hypothetical protein
MTRKGLLCLPLAVLCALALVDRYALQRGFLQEEIPVFDFLFLARTAAVASASFSFVAMWKKWNRVKGIGDRGAEESLWARRMVEPLLAAAVGCALLFLVSPAWFTALAREDRAVEMLSAAILLANAALFAWQFAAMRRYAGPNRGLMRAVMVGFSGVFFVIGMEEVSWMQRVLDVQTPDLFAGNAKNEMNLHNFDTNRVENAYYFGSFAALVVLPYLHAGLKEVWSGARNSWRGWPILEFFTPGRSSLLAASIFVPFNYDMWNAIPTQMAFFFTVAILLFVARASVGHECRTAWVALTTIISIQILFLSLGKRFDRIYDVTEYKELFIPLAFAVYGLEIAARVQRLRGALANPFGSPRSTHVQRARRGRSHRSGPLTLPPALRKPRVSRTGRGYVLLCFDSRLRFVEGSRRPARLARRKASCFANRESSTWRRSRAEPRLSLRPHCSSWVVRR